MIKHTFAIYKIYILYVIIFIKYMIKMYFVNPQKICYFSRFYIELSVIFNSKCAHQNYKSVN